MNNLAIVIDPLGDACYIGSISMCFGFWVVSDSEKGEYELVVRVWTLYIIEL